MCINLNGFRWGQWRYWEWRVKLIRLELFSLENSLWINRKFMRKSHWNLPSNGSSCEVRVSSWIVTSWIKMEFNGNLCQNKKIISGLLYLNHSHALQAVKYWKKPMCKKFPLSLFATTINHIKSFFFLFSLHPPKQQNSGENLVCGWKSEIHRLWFLLMGF